MTESRSIKIELAKGELTGKSMDIIANVFEVPPGVRVPRHTHPGEEVVYVLEGGTFEESDGRLVSFEPGMAIIYPRGVPHAGFKAIGDKPIKMLNVFIVDKGRPMTELV